MLVLRTVASAVLWIGIVLVAVVAVALTIAMFIAVVRKGID